MSFNLFRKYICGLNHDIAPPNCFSFSVTHSVSSSQVNAKPSSPCTQQKHKDIRPVKGSGGRSGRGEQRRKKREKQTRFKHIICGITALTVQIQLYHGAQLS